MNRLNSTDQLNEIIKAAMMSLVKVSVNKQCK